MPFASFLFPCACISIVLAIASGLNATIKLTVAAPTMPVTLDDLVFPFANLETAPYADKVVL